MKNPVFLGMLVLFSAHASLAQVGGGAAGGFAGASAGTSGAYNGSAGSYPVYGQGTTPAAKEQSKRYPTNAESRDDGTSTFIDASLLMNVKADEYVAVFGVLEEGKTPEEASTKMDATIAGFRAAIKKLGVGDDDVFVDYVVQNRVYGYSVTDSPLIQQKILKEELRGFELKKNVSIHFKDKTLVDQLAQEAAHVGIYDLIKVDYLVKNQDAIQAQLEAQTFALLKRKVAQYQTQLGVQLWGTPQILRDLPSAYFPVEQYSSYVAAESENIDAYYDRYTIQRARKNRTTYFNPLDGDNFDSVINPLVIEPVIQFTTYIKVMYRANPKGKKTQPVLAPSRGFGGFGGYGY